MHNYQQAVRCACLRVCKKNLNLNLHALIIQQLKGHLLNQQTSIHSAIVMVTEFTLSIKELDFIIQKEKKEVINKLHLAELPYSSKELHDVVNTAFYELVRSYLSFMTPKSTGTALSIS